MAAYIRQRPPRWFWLTGFAATLWGLFGATVFALYIMFGPALTAEPSRSDLLLSASLPGWFDVVQAAATLSALLGGFALMTRSAMARALFLLSLIFLVVQFGYMMFFTPIVPLMGWTTLLLPLLLIGVSAVEIWFADYARRHGWIS